jgi:two-component sensor histidine kinase
MPDASEFGRLLDFLQEPVFLVDGAGRVVRANAAATSLFGGAPVDRPLAALVADAPARVETYLRRCAGSGSPVPGALTLATPTGNRKLQVQGAAFERPGPDGSRASVILRCRPDATSEFSILGRKVEELNREVRQRRRAQAALEEALRHKETLLGELHHRVKNHTQMLLGMLSLAARQARTEELKIFIGALRSRLLAIGSAQQLMYQAGQLDTVGAPEFVARLCTAIGETWPEGALLSGAADNLELRNDVTASLALIVNELTANALKHGLEFGPGRVEVRLERCDGGIVLTVWDSGGRWRESDGTSQSSGLSLVRGLCRQIGGAFDIRAGDGTFCAVRFPYQAVEHVAR